jgi:hypothetical protein
MVRLCFSLLGRTCASKYDIEGHHYNPAINHSNITQAGKFANIKNAQSIYRTHLDFVSTPTTCSDSNCEIVTQRTETSCQVTNAYALSAMSAKCGTNGTAALAIAQNANGIGSGANPAAPAMVILSTLVGVLAIFA